MLSLRFVSVEETYTLDIKLNNNGNTGYWGSGLQEDNIFGEGLFLKLLSWILNSPLSSSESS